MDLKQQLTDLVTPLWKDSPTFDKDFAQHIIGAAISFYENEPSQKFEVFRFTVVGYPVPAKSQQDAVKIIVRTYDIWEPKTRKK